MLWVIVAAVAFSAYIGFLVLLPHLRKVRRDQESYPTGNQTGPLCVHEWRGVAAPYAMQCRKCNQPKFALDENGNFPDGLREYMEIVRTGALEPTPIPRPQWVCDNVIAGAMCGARMTVKTDCDKCGSGMAPANVQKKSGKFVEVWFCKTCGNTEQPNTGLGPIYVCPACQSWRKVNYV